MLELLSGDGKLCCGGALSSPSIAAAKCFFSAGVSTGKEMSVVEESGTSWSFSFLGLVVRDMVKRDRHKGKV